MLTYAPRRRPAQRRKPRRDQASEYELFDVGLVRSDVRREASHAAHGQDPGRSLDAASRGKDGRALVLCGLWLHIGLIGAAAFAVGLLQLLDGATMGPLALILGGGVLAAAGWRRARSILELADPTCETGIRR